MEFKTDIYIGVKKNDHYNKFAYGSLILLIALLFLLKHKPNALLNFVLIILVLIHFVIYFIGFFQSETFKYEAEIPLEINEEYIIINEKKFSWKDIRYVEIKYSDYEGKHIYRGKGDYNPSKSAGIDNYISFKTLENQQIKYVFRLYSSMQIDLLKQVFEEMARKRVLPYENIRSLYMPRNYEEIQKLKALYEGK